MFRSYTENIRRTNLKKNTRRTLQTYACDLCNELDLLTETDVELHRKEVHFPLIREQMENHMERFCTICMKLQENHSTLVSHVKTRHLLSSPMARRIEREIFICDQCDHVFFNKDLLEAHIMYSHMWPTKEKRMKKMACPKCKKMCRIKSIWFHLQLHEIPSISICDICLTNFWDVKELENHMKTHPMFYKCEICNYQTSKEGLYEAHLDYHHSSSYKQRHLKYKHILSGFVPGSSVLRYNIHHSLRGVELPRFFHICILCREICTDKIEAKTHLLRDHLKVEETKKRQYMCLCGAEFFNRVMLKHHIFKVKGDHRELREDEEAVSMPEMEVTVQETEPCPPEEGAGAAAGEGDQLAFIYAEVDENQLVTIDTENTEVVGF